MLLFKSIYSPQVFASANRMVLYLNESGVFVRPDGVSQVTVGAYKIIRNGMLFIERNGRIINVLGQPVR